MSETVIDTVASALALEIFRDNLKLRDQVDHMKEYLRLLENAISQDIGGDERFAKYVGFAMSLMPPRPSQ